MTNVHSMAKEEALLEGLSSTLCNIHMALPVRFQITAMSGACVPHDSVGHMGQASLSLPFLSTAAMLCSNLPI